MTVIDLHPGRENLESGDLRPIATGGGPGRALRRLAGVREDLIGWVPEELPRYTRLGAIVLNTGLLAGLSMLVAAGKVSTTWWPVLLLAAAAWAYLVISFDGWLVASTHGKIGGGRLMMYLPRLVVSLLFGFVVAEPLVIWIFQPAVTREVRDHQSAELSALESLLTRCNPTDGTAVTVPECADSRISLPSSPAAISGELNKTIIDRDGLREIVTRITDDMKPMLDRAADECGGVSGQGLTGRLGNGPVCQRLDDAIDKYRADNQLDVRQGELAALEGKVTTLTTNLSTAQVTYTADLGEVIAGKVEDRREEQRTIGLLDEMAALERLADDSGFALAGQWLLRALLIAIDCLPVLSKLFGGVTAYDRLVNRQLNVGDSMHERWLDLERRRHEANIEVARHQIAHDQRVAIERIDADDRATRARREAGKAAEIAELAARLRSKAG